MDFKSYTFCFILFVWIEVSAVLKDGDIRLSSSSSSQQGQLQILSGKFWRPVCYEKWTHENSQVACRSLGLGDVTRTKPMKASGIRSIRTQMLSYECSGHEPELTSCPEIQPPTSMVCDLVVWMSCSSRRAINKGIPEFPLSTPSQVDPEVEVTRINSNSIVLDWTEWYKLVKSRFKEDFVVRFHILYREAGAADSDFKVAVEIPSYFTYGSVQRLAEKTTYEFKVEVVRLGVRTEVAGITSDIVTATTTCSGPVPVSGVNATTQNLPGTQLLVSWTPGQDPKCPAEEFIIDYTTLSIEECNFQFDGDGLQFVGTTTEHQAMIYDLHPYSTYSISITAVNQYGRSTTKAYYEALTSEEAPSGSPTDISATFSTSRNILRISWGPPSCGNRNGIIVGYNYIVLNLETDTSISTGTTPLTTITLADVNPLEKYKVFVAAKTKVGMGPYGSTTVEAKADIRRICGEGSQTANVRISSGGNARKGAYPWMAQIWHIEGGKKVCAGSVLDEYWIISAAHCYMSYNLTPSDVRVQLGDYDTRLPEPQQRVYDVDRIVVHSGHNDLFDNDIALLRLSEPIEFSEYIKPICLPTKKLARTLIKTDGARGVVTGWGVNFTGHYPRYLQEVQVPVVDRKTCKQSTTHTFTQNMFCAGYSQQQKGDACLGDSGAPFSIRSNGRYYIVGIVSWGTGCDLKNRYGFYMKVYKYIGWMRRQHDGTLIMRDNS